MIDRAAAADGDAMKIFRGERVGTIYGSISIGSGLDRRSAHGAEV